MLEPNNLTTTTPQPRRTGENARPLLLVLGMHRSGTSALTGVLQILGARLGNRLLGPGPGNPKGYFEDGPTVATNQRLLDRFFDEGVRPKAPDWFDDTDLGGARRRIDETLAHFKRRKLPVIKDPRLCLTLPLWQRRARDHGLHVKLAFIARRPASVVGSLIETCGSDRETAARSLFLHMMQALENGRRMPKVLVTYERLLDDTDQTLAELSQFDDELDVTTERRTRVADFLDEGRCRADAHSRADRHVRVCEEIYEAVAAGDESRLYRTVDGPEARSLLAHAA